MSKLYLFRLLCRDRFLTRGATCPYTLILLLLVFTFTLSFTHTPAHAQTSVSDQCPVEGVQPRPANFDGDGLILTTFDRSGLWVVNPVRGSRAPLENTSVCGTNCHLSPDLRWFSYLDPVEGTFAKMRLDGSERTPLTTDEATEADWWSDDTLIVWSPSQEAYLQSEDGDAIEVLDVERVVSVQPGGRRALAMVQDGDGFMRVLVHLDGAHEPIELGADVRFFNAAAWSPDGRTLAYVVPEMINGTLSAALYGINLNGIDSAVGEPELWARFDTPTRIGGQTPRGGLSWSPDGERVTFWVIPHDDSVPLLDNPMPVSEFDPTPTPTPEPAPAIIHIYDVGREQLTRFCGYSTPDHTPNPPRLVWSPDGRYVAFGGDVENDTRGVLLIALDVEEGVYIELSYGIFPALGGADVIAWGLAP